jgi:hypothetical protein
MVTDEDVDVTSSRVFQDVCADSPLGRFLGLYVMKKILPLKPTTDSSMEMFWLGMKCSLHISSTYFRKLLTFWVLVLRLLSFWGKVSK